MKTIQNNIKEFDQLIHISHIDLDGYGSQLLTYHLYETGYIQNKIKYFNMDYNDEKKCINDVIEYILNDKTKTYFILITDIGLTKDGIKKLSNFLKGNKNIVIQLQLIDHHKSGAEFHESVNWYFFDNSYCATKLLYLYFISPLFDIKNISPQINLNYLKQFSDIVNAYDVWKQDDRCFFLGINLSDTIMNFIKYQKEFDMDYKRLHIMKYFNKFISMVLNGLSLDIIQSKLYSINTQILFELTNDVYYLNNDIPYEYKFQYYCTQLYKKDFNTFNFFEFNGYKFKVISLETNLFQNISHFLMDDKDTNCQMIINVKQDGKVSLRSSGDKFDVSKFAEIYLQGGGHFNAAGSGGDKIKFKPFFDQNTLEKSFNTFLKSL